jgi:hypothetical protein
MGLIEVGDMVVGTDGKWMIRPPQRCAQGHLLVGNCLVAAQPYSFGDRHLSWTCDRCEYVVYGPAAGIGLQPAQRSSPRAVDTSM